MRNEGGILQCRIEAWERKKTLLSSSLARDSWSPGCSHNGAEEEQEEEEEGEEQEEEDDEEDEEEESNLGCRRPTPHSDSHQKISPITPITTQIHLHSYSDLLPTRKYHYSPLFPPTTQII